MKTKEALLAVDGHMVLVQRKSIKKEDTTCVFKLTATPETVEQNGIELEFKHPIVYERFDSLDFRYRNPKQKEFKSSVTVERDSANLRRYIIRPTEKMLPGYEYTLKVPHHAFRNINGFYSDSTEVKVSLPTDEKLSILRTPMTNVDRKIIVDLLDESRKKTLRSYIIDSDTVLDFPYLQEGKYSIRITDDGNRNTIVDTGSILEHRQPEAVLFFTVGDKDYLEIPPSAEVEQEIDVKALFEQ